MPGRRAFRRRRHKRINYNLNNVIITAKYSDSTAKKVVSEWYIKSGGGTILENIYSPSGETNVMLSAKYQENSIIKEAVLNLSYINENYNVMMVETIKKTVSTENDTLNLSNGFMVNNIQRIDNNASAEISVSKIIHPLFNPIENDVYKLEINRNVNSISMTVPLDISNDISTLNVSFIDPLTNKNISLPHTIHYVEENGNYVVNSPRKAAFVAPLCKIVIKIVLPTVLGWEVFCIFNNVKNYYNPSKRISGSHIKFPFYSQQHADCWATTVSMMCCAAGKKLSSYQLCKIMNIQPNGGGLGNTDEIKKMLLFLDGYLSCKFDHKSFSKPEFQMVPSKAYYVLLKCLDEGIPVICNYADHSVVALGFIKNDKTGYYDFIIHEPSTGVPYKTVSHNFFSSATSLDFMYIIDKDLSNTNKLHTIEIPNSDNRYTLSSLLGIGFANNSGNNVANLSPNTESDDGLGYTATRKINGMLQDVLIKTSDQLPIFEKIHLKDISIYRTTANNNDGKYTIKTHIYCSNDNGKSYSSNPCYSNEKRNISIIDNVVKNPDLNFIDVDYKYDLTINKDEFVDKIKPENNYFILTIFLYDEYGALLDDTSVNFCYQKLSIGIKKFIYNNYVGEYIDENNNVINNCAPGEPLMFFSNASNVEWSTSDGSITNDGIYISSSNNDAFIPYAANDWYEIKAKKEDQLKTVKVEIVRQKIRAVTTHYDDIGTIKESFNEIYDWYNSKFMPHSYATCYDGTYRCYYKTGILQKLATYNKGTLSGEYYEQSLDGRLTSKGTFVNGVKNGIWHEIVYFTYDVVHGYNIINYDMGNPLKTDFVNIENYKSSINKSTKKINSIGL